MILYNITCITIYSSKKEETFMKINSVLYLLNILLLIILILFHSKMDTTIVQILKISVFVIAIYLVFSMKKVDKRKKGD